MLFIFHLSQKYPSPHLPFPSFSLPPPPLDPPLTGSLSQTGLKLVTDDLEDFNLQIPPQSPWS